MPNPFTACQRRWLPRLALLTILLLLCASNLWAQDTPTNTPIPPTGTATDLPTLRPTDTETPIPTDTPTETPTETIAPTLTPSETLTETPTETPTETIAPTATPTLSETPVETPTGTLTETPTLENSLTPSETATASETPPGPTQTELPTLTATSTLAVLPPERALTLVFSDNFDGGHLSAWQVNSSWSLVRGNSGLALQVMNTNEAARLVQPSTLLDAVIQARVLTDGGAARLVLRKSSAGAYSATLDANGQVNLYRAGNLFALTAVSPSEQGQWRTLRLSVIGTAIRVDVDGIEVIAVTDDAPLPPGSIGLGGTFSSPIGRVRFDDFNLWTPASEGINGAGSQVQALSVGQTYTVNSTNDVNDGTCDATHCSLREAINAANANPGKDTIAFNLSGPSPHTIRPLTGLPTITDPVVIDATTNPDFADTPVVVLDGILSSGTGDVDGFLITGGDSVIRGFTIERFSWNGIHITGAGGNVIQGNYIGCDVTATFALANSTGVFINESSNNQIGGTNPGDGNVVGGNTYDGIAISSATLDGHTAYGNIIQGNFVGTSPSNATNLYNRTGVIISASNNILGGTTPATRNVISGNLEHNVDINFSGNLVQGNYIGTNVTGTSKLDNWGDYGIVLGGSGNTIGGDTPGAGNVISGNKLDGIWIETSMTNNLIQDNYIGTDPTGMHSVLNGEGILIMGQNNVIGGTTPGARNIISGNDGQGIRIWNSAARGNIIQGNYVGTDATGNAALPNATYGVYVGNAPLNTIGGAATGAGNVISGNGQYGVAIFGPGGLLNEVSGNFIGLGADGVTPVGNGDNGVYIFSDAGENVVGGTSPGAGNVIAYNGGVGVYVGAGGYGNNTENGILGNSIFSNAGLGIDLYPPGVTTNDLGDTDTGQNNLQNFPVLTSAVIEPEGLNIGGSLNSGAGQAFHMEFFANPACDASGYGEGKRFIGAADITTNGSGNAVFSLVFSASAQAGEFITATAMDSGNNTSEFSACVTSAQATPTPTNTPTDTPTATPTATFTPTPTNTPTVTPTPTATLPPGCDFYVNDGDVAGLIDAIDTANGSGAAKTICLAANGAYTLTSAQSIDSNGGSSGLPTISSTLTISGNGATITRDTAAPHFRLVYADSSSNLTITNLTLSKGYLEDTTPPGVVDNGGGVLRSEGTLTLINVTLSDSYSNMMGGGLYTQGTTTLQNITVRGNQSVNDGGGITLYPLSADPPTVTINGGLIENNSSSSFGGGIAVSANLVADDLTVTGNFASSAEGGGIYLAGMSPITAAITNSTVSGNTGGQAGGIYNYVSVALTMDNVTVNDNTGGGILNYGPATLTHLTVSNNHGGGVENGSASGQFSITDSCIVGNAFAPIPGASLGLNNSSVITANATNDWWGGMNGPSPFGAPAQPGYGDAVYGSVNYSPFLTVAPPLCAGVGTPTPTPTPTDTPTETPTPTFTPTPTATSTPTAAPASAPTGLSPAGGVATNDNTPTFAWNPVTNGTSYHIQIDNGSTFSSPEQNFTIYALNYTATTMADGVWYWRVRAENNLGNGPWTLARALRIDTVSPNAPTFVGPANNATVVSARPSFAWNPVSGATQYRLQVDDNADFSSPIVNRLQAALTYALTTSLLPGTYNWRVFAQDAAGNVSAASLTRVFTFNNLYTPVNNAITTNRTPTFQWRTVAGATRYQLQLAPDTSFTSAIPPLPYITANGTVAGYIVPAASPLPYGIYYWRVNVDFGSGFAPSPIVRVITITPPAPVAPTLISPVNSSFTNDNTPDFFWGAVAGATQYRIQIDNTIVSGVCQFTSPEQNVVVASPAYTAAALADTVYCWRVRALNYLNVPGAWSAARKFMVDTVPPVPPTLSAPANGAMVTSVRPTLSWLAVSGANRYRVDVATDAGFVNLVVNNAEMTTLSYVPSTLSQGQYFWRVFARDAALNWGAYTARTFTVNIQTAPANGANIVSLTTARPTFQWASVPGGSGFQVQIASDMNFNSIIFTSPTLGTTTLSYGLPAANALGWGSYYWRVDVLNHPAVSPIFRQFYVTPTLPAAPTLVSPAGGATVGTNTPTLTWNTVTYSYGALTYVIQVDNNSAFTSPEFTLSGINGTQAVTTSLASGTYYWRVRAVNIYGAAGAWSASRSFKVP